MKQDNIPGYPGYYLDRKGNLWRFKEDKWDCKNMSRIVRRTKGEIVK
jgi:hypothetical protein